MSIPQRYYEGQAQELASWIQSQPREGKIDHIPFKPLSHRRYWLGIWIEVILFFIVLPILASWFIEAVIK